MKFLLTKWRFILYNMIDVNFFLGRPYDFKRICKIYPPTVNEVVDNYKFSIYIKLLTMAQEDIIDELAEAGEENTFITPLQYLLLMAQSSEAIESFVKESFFFSIHEEVTFLYDQRKIIIGDLEETLKQAETLNDLRILDETNFFDFQNQIRQSIGSPMVEDYEIEPDPRIRAMKAKARYRDRVKAKKSNLDLTTLLAAICCMQIGLTPLNIGEISYAAVSVLLEVYQHKEKYDIDIRSLLAGADSKKVNPEYWIANFDKK